MLFFIAHFRKLSADILERSWLVCLKILPICLHLFPECEYSVSEKISEHGIQSEVFRDILLLIPKGQMTLKGIPREVEINHSYFTFPRLHQLTLLTLSLSAADFQSLTVVHSSLFWTFMSLGGNRWVNSGMFFFRNKRQMSLYRQLWNTNDLRRYWEIYCSQEDGQQSFQRTASCTVFYNREK